MQYIGGELELFQHAYNWKAYYASLIKFHINGDVLEVGAGMGGTTPFLLKEGLRTWTCLEPDKNLAELIRNKINLNELPSTCSLMTGTIHDVPDDRQFDTIIYIDVIEHIENDAQELLCASRHLRKGGALIVLAPACQYLFNSFDKVLGHYRRYNKMMMQKIAPKNLKEHSIIYVDSLGILLSLGNKMFLRKGLPTPKQIKFWDSKIIPISRCIDRIINYKIGKSIIAIWETK